jgi:ketosteroid isomerase-like protein
LLRASEAEAGVAYVDSTPRPASLSSQARLQTASIDSAARGMHPSDQQALVIQFNECINRRDADGLAALMTSDHAFIDTADHVVSGREKVVGVWKGFFKAFPDYRNVFETFACKGDCVTVAGRSTCSDERLDGPAIWTAKIRDNQVAEWRVYEDSAANRRLLGIA